MYVDKRELIDAIAADGSRRARDQRLAAQNAMLVREKETDGFNAIRFNLTEKSCGVLVSVGWQQAQLVQNAVRDAHPLSIQSQAARRS